MEISKLPRSIPLLASLSRFKNKVSVWRVSLWRFLAISAIYSITCGYCRAYTVITSTSPSLEQAFIASTTNQFLGTVVTNPLFPNTFQINLTGTNPAFNPPPTGLEQALSLGSTVYVYGFADGQAYERKTDLASINYLYVNCSTTTVTNVFTLTQSTPTTFDRATCSDALHTSYDTIFDQNFSTPTVIPPPAQ